MASKAGHPPRDEHRLSVLSFNVWGLAFVSKDRPPRIRAVAEHLAQSSYDVVCLQELWIYKDYEIVRERVREVLPHSRFFHTGALGSGLAIFTRFPIISAQALPYSLSGVPLHVIAGDFYVNKAAGSIVILHDVLGEVEIWSTHMHAAGEGGPETNRAHRIAQAWQLANAVRASAERGRYVIASGDYNSLPTSLPLALLKSHAGLLDAFLVTHPSSLSAPPAPADDPAEALRVHGMTCDSPLNTYSAGKPLGDEAKRWGGKRLDYTFYRGPEVARRRPLRWRTRSGPGAAGRSDVANGTNPSHMEEGKPILSSLDDAPVLTAVDTQVVLTDRVPGEAFSYSDHFGLLTTFEIRDSEGGKGAGQVYLDDGETTQHRPLPGAGGGGGEAAGPLIDVQQNGDGAAPHREATAADETASPSKADIVHAAHSVLTAYSALSARTARTHLRLFAGSIVFALALTISSAWQPKSYIQPIWTLLGVAAGAGGATMLYVGFVWGRWEDNLLKEVTGEMELECRVLEMEGERRASGATHGGSA